MVSYPDGSHPTTALPVVGCDPSGYETSAEILVRYQRDSCHIVNV